MPIETFGNIDSLDPANPTVDDPVSEGDDHLRGIKESLQGNVQGDETFTALLADGFIQALVDALAFTVKGPPLIDLDGSAGADPQIIQARNSAGGWRVNVLATGDLQFDEVDETGAFVSLGFTISKAGAMTMFHDASNGLRTALRTPANSSAEVFDGAGTARPVGFHVMPRVTFSSSGNLTAAHNGVRLRTQNAITLTIPLGDVIPVDGVFVISVRTNVTTIDMGGNNLVFFDGFGGAISTTGGTLTAGGVLTMTNFGNSAYEAWGSGFTPD